MNCYKPDDIIAYKSYPFGSTMPGRSFSSGEYRYGFNGHEKDDDMGNTDGAVYDYGFRIYDSRIAKFTSVDPLTQSYPWYSPYQFAGNKPIWAVDLDGLEEKIAIYSTDNEPVILLASDYNVEQWGILQNAYGALFKGTEGKLVGQNDYENLATTDANGKPVAPARGTLNVSISKYGVYGNYDKNPLNIETKQKSTAQKLHESAKIVKEGARQLVPDAGEANIQGSVPLSPGVIVTGGASLFHADDGFAIGFNVGLGVSSDILPSYSGNINAFYSNEYKGELSLGDLKGFESTTSISVPVPTWGVSLGGNDIKAEKYNGFGLNVSPLSAPSVSTNSTYTIIPEE